MSTAIDIDKKIITYLQKLNNTQKETVLTVVKQMANNVAITNDWNNENFVSELDERTKAYENGSAKVYSLNELEFITRKAFAKKHKA